MNVSRRRRTRALRQRLERGERIVAFTRLKFHRNAFSFVWPMPVSDVRYDILHGIGHVRQPAPSPNSGGE